MKHHESLPMRQSIKDVPKLYVDALFPHLRYVLLDRYDMLLVIIADDLNVQQLECLVEVLTRFKRATG